MDDAPGSPSHRLCRMAEHINRNAGATFGGAVVIIPPDQGGEPVEILFSIRRGIRGSFGALSPIGSRPLSRRWTRSGTRDLG